MNTELLETKSLKQLHQNFWKEILDYLFLLQTISVQASLRQFTDFNIQVRK